MISPDLINGSFELIAGCLLWLNVIKLYRDKKVLGVDVRPTAFFMLWGYWNLYYYPHLNQMASFFGGLNVVLANTIWVAQMIYYRRG